MNKDAAGEFINFNGSLLPSSQPVFTPQNRAFRYGDGLFESIRIARSRICFLDRHFLRLKYSMELLGMNQPDNFNADFLGEQIAKLVAANHHQKSARVRLSVFRNEGGLYTPDTNSISWIIESSPMTDDDYAFLENGLKIDIYQEYRKGVNRLSNLKSSNALLYVLAAVYKKEKGLDDCVLVNQQYNVIETISANLFAVKNGVLYTCPISEGCVDGVMRSIIMDIARENRVAVYEVPMPMSVLFNSDEVFLTNAAKGVMWVAEYKGKRYTNETCRRLQTLLNEKIMI